MTTRRFATNRAAAIDRPRIKGWRDTQVFEDSDADEDVEAAPLRPPAQRRSTPAPRHKVTPVGRLLSTQQIEAIRAIMRLFLTDDRARGVPADLRLRCESCGITKWAAGYVRYGRSNLCNDCAADYEISRLRGQSDTATDFLRRKAERAAG